MQNGITLAEGKFLIQNYIQLLSFLTPGKGVLIKTTTRNLRNKSGGEEKSTTQVGGRRMKLYNMYVAWMVLL